MPADLDIAALRVNYSRQPLLESALSPDPFAQFSQWLAEAVEARLKDPNAMSLATVSAEGAPSSRMVLLKGLTGGGFVFYTNLGSRKARQLALNPRCALNFFWPELERQVCVEGEIQPVSREEADAYFHSRPIGSQLGAWASEQSKPVPSREYLEEKLRAVGAQYADGEVPLPAFWGGFRVIPLEVEFWQGGPSRIHDRLRYSRSAPGSAWSLQRLSP